MFKLFRLILGRNIGSILTLFFVLFLASTGFLVMRQLAENIEVIVSQETRPLFGADIRVSPRDYVATPIIETLTPYLSGIDYSWGERTEFSTTLFDREGKTGLVNVIAYTGEYPQKGILELSPSQIPGEPYVAVTEGLMNRFASSGSLTLDGIKIPITHTIVNSSDLGFSFGSDNHLLILPVSTLSGSMLISSGSRLDQDLLLSFAPSLDIKNLSDRLKKIPELSEYRIQNYSDRSERTMETTEELTDYILLILVIAAIFAGIILRSAHDALFSDLARTLRIVEILGFSRKRQMGLFFLLYSIIIPLSFTLSCIVSYGIIEIIAMVPEASDFQFFISPVFFTIQIFLILILASFLPPWIQKFQKGTNRGGMPKFFLFSENILGRISKKLIPASVSKMFFSHISFREATPLIVGILGIIFLIFERFFWSLMITGVSMIVFLLCSGILFLIYRSLFRFAERWRNKYFFLFDGIRTLVRPLTPSIPITLSLLGITSFFVVFLLFSFSFREKLLLDTQSTANIYAINVLESDREGVEKLLSDEAKIYSILRARISRINNKTLAEHLKVENPSGEFTREFNVTTDTISAPVIRGNPTIQSNEVSVDEDFAQRLSVTLGDSIEFLLSGRKITLTVANIRKSVREGFEPFFYFSFEKEAFKTAPKTYFVSASVSDTELWKKNILDQSGPHVTFIDIENILSIVQDISKKILAVISLFFGAISIFGILAIFSLFARLHPVEFIKSRLYSLFGMTKKTIRSLFQTTRITLLLTSLLLSFILGIGIYGVIVSQSAFLTLSFSYIVLVGFFLVLGYFLLYIAIRPRNLRK